MSGQTLNDRLTAARHTLAGQGLARVVCKATTEEVIGPKKKHLDYLLHCTNEPNVSIPQLANLLIERTQHASWVVVFKALITVHHLMCYGNERFTQYLASSNCTFQLSNFLDKSSVQSAYDMSTFIRRYAKYLNEKALSYRTVAFDFCKVKRGKDDGMLRTMNTDKLLKTLPALQGQLDALLEFDCTSNDLTNGVINSSFMLLFRDLIRLFACYNDGIINLLEKYFDMNKKNCREALDIYKKFLIRMDRVAEFLKVAENVGIDKGDIPDLTKLTQICSSLDMFGISRAPSSLLDALEQHLNALEGKRGATTTSAASRSTNLKNAVSALSSTSSAFGNAAAANGAANTSEVNGIRLDDAAARKALEEEAAVMNQLKFEDDSSQIKWEQPCWDDVERRMREVQSTDPSVTKTNPFLASPTPESQPPSSQTDGLVDLFTSPTNNASAKASDDLLCLSGNPFADSLFGGSPTSPQQQPPSATPTQFMPFGTNGFAAPTQSAGTFASDASFAAVFGSSNDTSPRFDAFGDVLQPMSSNISAKTINGTDSKTKGVTGLIKGDLDSSLASLAQNLDINGPKQSLKKGPGGHQWGSPKVSTKTGGSSWGPGGPPAGAVPGVTPPAQAMAPNVNWGGNQQFAAPGGAQWGNAGGMMAGPFPTQPTSGIMPNQAFGMAKMRPMAPAGMGMGMMGMGANATPQMTPQAAAGAPVNIFGTTTPMAVPPMGASPSGGINDPFGAL